MKNILITAFSVMTLNSFSQDKYNHVHFNKVTEVRGTEYVIASIENWGKMSETKSRYLLFINTKTGEKHQVDFPDDAYLRDMEQVKLDSLGINLVLLGAKTVDLDNKTGID
jgi:hypothetical protein